MKKSKNPEPEQLKAHPLLGLRVNIVRPALWSGNSGTVEIVYNNACLMVLTDRNFHTKIRGDEYQLCLWSEKINQVIEKQK